MFGVSKQAYYKLGDETLIKAVHARFIVEFVNIVRLEDKGIGGEKLWYMYKNSFGNEYSVGRDAFCNILKQNNLNIRRSKKRCRTTDSNHGLDLHPNIIKNVVFHQSNRVWVSDITYIRLLDGFCFLSLITDAYNHKVIGAYVGETLHAEHSIKALYQAFEGLSDEELSKVIHHSDRGVQYASDKYVAILKKRGIKISMTESGDPKDNAIAERINGILKEEFLNRYEFKTIQEVRKAVVAAVDFYNNKRPHRSLDMLTPAQASTKTGPIHKRWVSLKDKYMEDCSFL